MIKKEYFTPEADILRMNAEVNFCESVSTNTGLNDFDLLDPSGLDWE